MIPLAIQMIADDDDRAFMENLYEKYRLLMLSEIQKIIAEPWDAEDVMQTVIERLIGKIALLKTLSTTRMTNYIITACRNTAISLLREQKRAPTYSFDESLDSLDDSIFFWQNSMEEDIVQRLESDIVYQAWQQLPQEVQSLLKAKYLLKQKDVEIASVLGIQASSVRMALTRAKRTFKDKLLILQKSS